MDTTQYGESKYLTPQLIRESPQPTDKKLGIIISDADTEDGKFGKQLVVQVSFDKKIKFWKLTKDNVKSLHKVSKESSEWITRKVWFSVQVTPDNKERILSEVLLD